jgi:ABC-2 type transport system permease protein
VNDTAPTEPECATTAWLPAALWTKCRIEAQLLLVSLAAVNFIFSIVYVWLTSQVDLGALATFLKALPESFERVAGVPFGAIATPTGRLAMAYVDPVTVFTAVAWGIARGSDCISGELGRGTMELLLAQPVRRSAVVVVQGIVTTLGSVVIAAASWLGMWVGVHFTGLEDGVDIWRFVPAALNLFGFMFFLAGFSTLVSACGRDRRRTVGVVAGFYLLQVLMKVVGRAATGWEALLYGTFITAFEPQSLAIHPATAWVDVARADGLLIVLGLICYAAATLVFCRRDLPAPL